jgi:hypothetical protein
MIAAAPGNGRFRHISETYARLIRLMQDVQFGRITFRVRAGCPDPDRPYRTVRTVKLAGGENSPRPAAGSVDFTLRKEHAALLATLDHLDDGACVTIEVKHGLPFILEIEQDHQS